MASEVSCEEQSADAVVTPDVGGGAGGVLKMEWSVAQVIGRVRWRTIRHRSYTARIAQLRAGSHTIGDWTEACLIRCVDIRCDRVHSAGVLSCGMLVQCFVRARSAGRVGSWERRGASVEGEAEVVVDIDADDDCEGCWE